MAGRDSSVSSFTTTKLPVFSFSFQTVFKSTAVRVVAVHPTRRHLDRVSRGVDVGVLEHDRHGQRRHPPVRGGRGGRGVRTWHTDDSFSFSLRRFITL